MPLDSTDSDRPTSAELTPLDDPAIPTRWRPHPLLDAAATVGPVDARTVPTEAMSR